MEEGVTSSVCDEKHTGFSEDEDDVDDFGECFSDEEESLQIELGEEEMSVEKEPAPRVEEIEIGEAETRRLKNLDILPEELEREEKVREKQPRKKRAKIARPQRQKPVGVGSSWNIPIAVHDSEWVPAVHIFEMDLPRALSTFVPPSTANLFGEQFTGGNALIFVTPPESTRVPSSFYRFDRWNSSAKVVVAGRNYYPVDALIASLVPVLTVFLKGSLSIGADGDIVARVVVWPSSGFKEVTRISKRKKAITTRNEILLQTKVATAAADFRAHDYSMSDFYLQQDLQYASVEGGRRVVDSRAGLKKVEMWKGQNFFFDIKRAGFHNSYYIFNNKEYTDELTQFLTNLQGDSLSKMVRYKRLYFKRFSLLVNRSHWSFLRLEKPEGMSTFSRLSAPDSKGKQNFTTRFMSEQRRMAKWKKSGYIHIFFMPREDTHQLPLFLMYAFHSAVLSTNQKRNDGRSIPRGYERRHFIINTVPLGWNIQYIPRTLKVVKGAVLAGDFIVEPAAALETIHTSPLRFTFNGSIIVPIGVNMKSHFTMDKFQVKHTRSLGFPPETGESRTKYANRWNGTPLLCTSFPINEGMSGYVLNYSVLSGEIETFT